MLEAEVVEAGDSIGGSIRTAGSAETGSTSARRESTASAAARCTEAPRGRRTGLTGVVGEDVWLPRRRRHRRRGPPLIPSPSSTCL